MQLQLPNGIIRPVERDHIFGWYIVRGLRPTLGARVTLDGIPREVVIVAQLRGGRFGVGLLPDFEDPGCRACEQLDPPPSPEDCRVRCHADANPPGGTGRL